MIRLFSSRKNLLLSFCLFLSCILRGQTPDPIEFIDSLDNISDSFPHNSDTVLYILNQLLETPFVKNNPDLYGTTIVHLGREWRYKKLDGGKSKMYYEKALKYAEATQSCFTEVYALSHIALIYHDLNKYDDKITAFEKAARIGEKCLHSNGLAYVYTQLGLGYADSKEFKKAEIAFSKADSVIKSRSDIRTASISFFYSAMLEFYGKTKNKNKFEQVVNSFYKMFIVRSNKDKEGLDLYFFVARILNRLGKIDSAIYYARLVNESKSEKKFGSYVESIMHSNRLLAELYEKKGDLKKALYYERNYIASLDSITNVSGVQSFKARIKNLEDELEIQKQENKSKNSRFLIVFISFLVAITLVILIFTYRNAQKYQKLNMQLEAQKQELTSLNNIRSRMFSILSHDLRSPIGALKNMIDLYHTKTLSRQDFDSFILDLKQNLNAILDTLNNILDWSFAQLRGKKPYIESLNAHMIVNEQLELQAEVARQKHILISNNIPKDFTIQADYNHFSLITRNLINNAIKYTLDNGHIEINAAVTEGGKTIDFIDSGIGIDEDKLQALIQKKFSQSENYEGKGLGLQIIHDFLEYNNCQLSIKSQRNIGSIFTLTFPT